MELKELVVIEEIEKELRGASAAALEPHKSRYSKYADALVLLKAMLEGKGEEERLLAFIQTKRAQELIVFGDNPHSRDVINEHYNDIGILYSRLALRARLNEAALVEAKRGALEEAICTIKSTPWIEPSLGRLTEADRRCGQIVSDILGILDQQLASGKEEKSGKD